MKRLALLALLLALLIPGAPSPDAAAATSTPVLKWAYAGCFASWCQTGWYASPAVADLDNDGQAEVIWGAYDLVVLNGNNGDITRTTSLGLLVGGVDTYQRFVSKKLSGIE